MLLLKAFGDDECCSYIDGPASACGAPVKHGSPYCGQHHAVCYIPEGSQREARKLKEFAYQAGRRVIVVGGEIIPVSEIAPPYMSKPEPRFAAPIVSIAILDPVILFSPRRSAARYRMQGSDRDAAALGSLARSDEKSWVPPEPVKRRRHRS